MDFPAGEALSIRLTPARKSSLSNNQLVIAETSRGADTAKKSSLALIDKTVIAWCNAHDHQPIVSNKEEGCIFFYVSGKNDSSFQIEIYPLENGSFRVYAWDVETRNGEVFGAEWISGADNITEILDAAVSRIEQWDSTLRLQ